MVLIKTDDEIEKIRNSSLIVSKVLGEIAKLIKPGITTLELDKIAEEYIRDNGALPGFKGYRGFPSTLCTSINDVVVHGIPNNKPLENGDILSVDCGVLLDGYYGDSAYTFAVGEISEKNKQLLEVTKESLYKAIEQSIVGKRLGDVADAIQSYVEKFGYSVVREMVGHGIGKNLHEDPEVLNYGRRGTGLKLQKGLVICIEPMINMGKKNIFQENDGWTIRTRDRMPSAHFELTVAINYEKADVLSTFNYIDLKQ
jgi:methionyl aminopeptidase